MQSIHRTAIGEAYGKRKDHLYKYKMCPAVVDSLSFSPYLSLSLSLCALENDSRGREAGKTGFPRLSSPTPRKISRISPPTARARSGGQTPGPNYDSAVLVDVPFMRLSSRGALSTPAANSCRPLIRKSAEAVRCWSRPCRVSLSVART